ncbi:MAG: ComF family protein [Anaerolineae bacterium]
MIFPPRCAGCGRVDTVWCESCQAKLEAIPVNCSLKTDIPHLQWVASTEVHQGLLREAVQGLKYGNVPQLGAELGLRLVACLEMKDWTIDMLIPVPLHTQRLKERGYNQAQIVCEYVAAQTGLPCIPQALIRDRYSHSQVGLSPQERKENVADAFSAIPELVSHHNILIIDDVCTTGSTLSACAQALLKAGARQVSALTVTAARV